MNARSLLWTTLAVLLALPVAADDEHLSELERRGKQVYAAGESISGAPITAIVSRGATPIPASILPCSGCHGDDGAGRPEGGVVPTDISWDTLVSPYGHKHSYGRSHPAYDEASIADAIVKGIDPAGNELDMAMPRYSMPAEDMAALLAYLKVIASDYDPGVTGDSIRVGTLLPLKGDMAPMGTAMRRVLEAALADINDSGGIHGRKLELVVAEYVEDPVRTMWNVRDLVQQESVFALVGGLTSGIGEQLSELAEELEVPIVGPYTQEPREGNGLERHIFYLTGGIEQQVAVLVRHGVAKGDKVVVVHPASAAYGSVVARAVAEADSRAGTKTEELAYTPPYLDAVDTCQQIESRGIDAVVFLGPAVQLRRLGDECARLSVATDLLFPGVFAGQDLFGIDANFDGRLMVGYSSTPADHTPLGVAEFEGLHERHGFGFEYSAAQISSFVAVKVFAEGLKRAGQSLSREKLLIAMEGLADFQPGLMPAISYNRSRRIGAFGGYVLTIDLANKRVGESSNWITLQL